MHGSAYMLSPASAIASGQDAYLVQQQQEQQQQQQAHAAAGTPTDEAYAGSPRDALAAPPQQSPLPALAPTPALCRRGRLKRADGAELNGAPLLLKKIQKDINQNCHLNWHGHCHCHWLCFSHSFLGGPVPTADEGIYRDAMQRSKVATAHLMVSHVTCTFFRNLLV